MERMVKQNMEGIKNLDANVRNLKSDLKKLVVLQKEATDNSTNIIGNKSTCSSGRIPISGTDCADILKKYPDTRGKDGVYNIVGLSRTKAVYCDMTTENGGWTVIQRRVNGSVDFNNNWTEYKNGFGFADHEHWIGDSLRVHNNMKFSTPEEDNDNDSGSCAITWRSGWWFNGCYYANPNGQYTDSEKTGWKYITWYHWRNSQISLKTMQLMIRPRF